jgi:bacterioferritin-associated ferredoxin
MSVRIERQLRWLGIKVEARRQLVAVDVNVDTQAQSVRLDDDRRLRADRVVLACGMTPNTTIAAQAGLAADEGVCVDAGMRTADPAIVAVGDCAQPPEGPGQGSIAHGIDQAERAIAAITRAETIAAPSAAWPREIRLGRLKFVSIRRMSDETATAGTPLARYAWRRAYALEFVDDRIVSGTALMPAAAIGRLRQLVERDTGLRWWRRWQLRLGRIPASGAPAEQIICHCAGVTRGQIEKAAEERGASLAAVEQATGAGQYCGGCLDEVESVLAGDRPHFAWAALSAGLLLTALAVAAAWVPPVATGANVQALWFKAHALLTTNVMRQVTGYTMLAFIALALWVTAPSSFPGRARGRWLHVLYGTLAVVLIPVHALGGVRVGGGLNGVLNAILLACVLVGVAVWIKRSWRRLVFWHSLLTVVLLAALVLHIIYVYQY